MANKVNENGSQQLVPKANGKKTPPKDLPIEDPNQQRRYPRRSTRSTNPLDQEPLNLPSIIPLSDDDVVNITDCKIKDTLHIIVQVPLKLLVRPYSQKTSLNCDDPSAIMQVEYDNTNDSLLISMSVDREDQQLYSVSGRILWVGAEIENRSLKQSFKKLSRNPALIVKHKHKDSISDLFVVLTVEPKFNESEQYNGLVNKGSTCYMNSFLQMLNHLDALRNLVFRLKNTKSDKFPGTLQNLFYKLATNKKAVSTDALIKSYGWTKEQNFVQQDVQEFSCLFFEVLQRKINEQPDLNGSLNGLIEGELTNYIECINVDVRSEFNQKFIELQLQVSGFTNLEDSLSSYLHYEVLEGDNMYRTEKHGLQAARKGVRIGSVGPVLMIQLKRFQYNYETEVNQKILDRFEYPDTLSLGNLVNIPHLPEYNLYAVLVHSGERASSGHYYAYLKIQEKWHKFNDQKVTEASPKQVFDYNFGGEKMTRYVLDQRQLILKETEEVIGSTAYMLVYYNSKMKETIFDSRFEIPEWIKERIEKEKEEEMVAQNQVVSVRIIRWSDLQGKPADGKGLIKMDQWENYLQMQVGASCFVDSFMDMLFIKKATIFLLEFSKSGQVLSDPFERKTKTVGELFKKSYSPAIVIFENSQTAMSIEKEQNPLIAIIKLFFAAPQTKVSFTFSQFIVLPKDAKSTQLIEMLQNLYSEENYSIKFYEQRDDGKPYPLESNKFLIPKARSREVTIIVEKINLKMKRTNLFDYFQEKGKMLDVILKSQDGKVQKKCQLPRGTDVAKLRKYIFEDLLNKSQEYVSPANITIKTKTSKNSKRFFESKSGLIENFVKYEDTIIFGFSKMDYTQRENNFTIIEFRYRYRSLLLSQPIDLIVSKQLKKNIYESVGKESRVEECLKIQGATAYHVAILNPQMNRILALFLQNDENIFKVWKQNKGSALLVEAHQAFEVPSYSILCYHKTKNGQGIGSPFAIELKKTQSMAALFYTVINLSKQQNYSFDGKTHHLNAAKTSMVVYRLEQSPSAGIELHPQVDTPLEILYPDDDFLELEITHNYLARTIKTMKIDV